MSIKKIIYIGLFAAIAFILMITFSIPILPNAPYLRFEPSEIPILLSVCLFGPWAGLLANLVKDLLYFLFRAKSIFGPTADFIATSSFVMIFGILFTKFRNNTGFILSLAAGIIGRILVMVPVNIVVLRLQFGMSPAQVMDMMVPVIIPFNLIKGGINAVGVYFVFKALVKRAQPLLETLKIDWR